MSEEMSKRVEMPKIERRVGRQKVDFKQAEEALEELIENKKISEDVKYELWHGFIAKYHDEYKKYFKELTQKKEKDSENLEEGESVEEISSEDKSLQSLDVLRLVKGNLLDDMLALRNEKEEELIFKYSKNGPTGREELERLIFNVDSSIRDIEIKAKDNPLGGFILDILKGHGKFLQELQSKLAKSE